MPNVSIPIEAARTILAGNQSKPLTEKTLEAVKSGMSVTTTDPKGRSISNWSFECADGQRDEIANWLDNAAEAVANADEGARAMRARAASAVRSALRQD